MKEVIERLFARMPSGPVMEMDRMKREILSAAEEGPEGIRRYFDGKGQVLVEEAKRLAGEVKSKAWGTESRRS